MPTVKGHTMSLFLGAGGGGGGGWGVGAKRIFAPTPKRPRPRKKKISSRGVKIVCIFNQKKNNNNNKTWIESLKNDIPFKVKERKQVLISVLNSDTCISWKYEDGKACFLFFLIGVRRHEPLNTGVLMGGGGVVTSQIKFKRGLFLIHYQWFTNFDEMTWFSGIFVQFLG